jgi:uncharacterized membrane protein YebE (DUF533 family)
MTTEERDVLSNDHEIYLLQRKAIMREIRASRGGFMVRQLVEQLNALEMVVDRLEAKLKEAKVPAKAKK